MRRRPTGRFPNKEPETASCAGRGRHPWSNSAWPAQLGVSRNPPCAKRASAWRGGAVLKSANRSFIVRRVDLGEIPDKSLRVREVLEVRGGRPGGRARAARRCCIPVPGAGRTYALGTARSLRHPCHWACRRRRSTNLFIRRLAATPSWPNLFCATMRISDPACSRSPPWRSPRAGFRAKQSRHPSDAGCKGPASRCPARAGPPPTRDACSTSRSLPFS